MKKVLSFCLSFLILCLVIGLRIINTPISDINIYKLDWTTGAELFSVLILSVITIILTRCKYGFIIISCILFSISFGVEFLYHTPDYLFDVTVIIFSILAIHIYDLAVNFSKELNKKFKIKTQFDNNVSPNTIKKLQKNSKSLTLDGELDYYYDMMLKRIQDYMEDESFPKNWKGI